MRWGISERRVRLLCSEGRVLGAYQVGRGWNIPSDAPKPNDNRFKANTIQRETVDDKLSILKSSSLISAAEQKELEYEFSVEYLFNSSAMEGNILNIYDTDLILRGFLPEDKPLHYAHELQCHKKAFDFIIESAKVKRDLSAELVKQIHYLVLEDKYEDRGEYRSIPIRFFGSTFLPAQPYMIDSEIDRLIYDYNRSKESICSKLAKLHIKFESIRPFIDGNGRVGRLIVNFELLKAGYPPIIFRFVDSKKYFEAFETYHSTGSSSNMETLFLSYLEEQLDNYINISRSKPRKAKAINNYMEKIVNQFKYEGNAVSCETFGSGHINKSFFVTTDTAKKYVLQCISSVAFHDVPGLMKNAIAVSKHIKSKGGNTLNFIPSLSGEYYYKDDNGDYWRSYELVDALCLDAAEKPEDFYEAAVAFGTFQNMLDDFPAETLCETIPNFHNTPDRFTQLHNAINSDSAHRVNQILPEIEFALSREDGCGELMEMLYTGALPLRVTHNDTKLNNVLFDKETRKGICVIDLDTVMPGLSAFDFGDAVRYGASTAAEDEQDLSKVQVNLYLFRLFARGFLKACPKLTENEKDVLTLGAKIITLELGVRFLTDYLNGDKYFRVNYPEHNLDRARTQFKLVSDMEKHWSDLEAIVKEESYRFI